MTRKHWAILTLTLLIGSIGGIVSSVVIIDPFKISHQATAFIPPITNGTQIYSNAGIAKQYEYDSLTRCWAAGLSSCQSTPDRLTTTSR